MKKRGNTRPWLLLLAMVGVCTLTLHAYSWYRWDRVRRLTILYGSDLRGELDPCACVEGRLGGLSRRSTYVARAREEGYPILLVDSGGLFFRDRAIPPFLSDQLSSKAYSIVGAYDRMGYDLVNVGDLDLALGPGRLRELGAKASFALLSANLVDGDGKRLFPSHVIRQVGKLKVGIFGLLGGKGLQQPIQVKDAIGVAREIVTKLRQEVDVLVCLSYQGLSQDVDLARAVKGIDVIIGGGSETSLTDPKVENGTIILQGGRKGSTIGRFDLVLYNDRLPWIDATQTQKFGRLAKEYDAVVAKQEAILQRSEDPGEKYAAKRMVERYMREARLARGRVRDFFSKNHFYNQVIPLTDKFGDDDVILEVIENYKSSVRALSEVGRPKDGAGEVLYMGAQSCRNCHQGEYDSWKVTLHAHAYATLEKTEQEFDLECVGCHTTGYRKEGGFDSAAAVGQLKDVQCEVCHGPGAGHPGEKEKLPLLVSKDVCLECHTKEFNSDFDFDRFWARISHDNVEQDNGKTTSR